MKSQSDTVIVGADVVGPEQVLRGGAVLFSGTRIVSVGGGAREAGRRRGARRVDGRGCYLVPGFVDLHTHGAAGVDFARASASEFEHAMRFYLRHGVTSLLASLYPMPWKTLLKVVERVAGYVHDAVGGGAATGIHLEGPYLNPKRPGALPARHFRTYRPRELNALLDAGGGTVRTMTVAPERPGGHALVRHLIRRGVVPAFGHSEADYAAARAGIRAGIRYATHLFNAMRGIHHRSPGAVTALLERADVFVELIADGHHVHGPVMSLVQRDKPPERVILVSDSVQPCGLKAGAYEFAGTPVRLKAGRITLADGTLAGSALTLPRAVEVYVKKTGAEPAAAFRAASSNPARAIGDRRRGLIRQGKRADLVLIDRRFRVRATWLGGRLVHSAP